MDMANAINPKRRMEAFQADYARLVDQIGRVMVGHQDAIDGVLACLLCGGHVLLEGIPGIGKTQLVHTLGQATRLSFSRIQFTPDLMPADITGTEVLCSGPAQGKDLVFQPGPVFAHLVLADEINRATPKTQSALLEAMSETSLSCSGESYALPQPFMVLATQNPLEMEGTYPLPEAQLDRFMLQVSMKLPLEDEWLAILNRTTATESPRAEAVLDSVRLLQMRADACQVLAAEPVQRYLVRLVLATHPENEFSTELVRRYVRFGASPRAAQAILRAARVRALRQGNWHVSMDDARAFAMGALRHRLGLSFRASSDGVTVENIVEEVLRTVRAD